MKINGIPILEHQLKILIKNNINEIYIVIGFKGYLIKNYIKKKFAHLNIVFIENKIFIKLRVLILIIWRRDIFTIRNIFT